MAKIGRPSKYTPELAKEICDAIATSTLSLNELADMHDHWPIAANIWRWRNTNSVFRSMYTKAKKEQVDVSIDFMQQLINEPHKNIDPATGRQIIDVPMLRVKIDAIKWKAAKLMPRDWGDNKDLEATNTELTEDIKKRQSEMDERNRKDF